MNSAHIAHARRYHHESGNPSCAHPYLLPRIEKILDELTDEHDRRIFDLGCGNGSVDHYLQTEGYEVVGVDPSEKGIAQARKNYPHLDVHLGSGYDDLAARFGRFPAVISLEVIEHVYYPRDFARTLYDLVEPGGHAVVSTPYHGYLKNVCIALAGEWGRGHYDPSYRDGHIKIWHTHTLRDLLTEAGFEEVEFYRVGRIPPLAKSMIAVASKAQRKKIARPTARQGDLFLGLDQND